MPIPPRYVTFKITDRGRDYNATWHVEGRELLVSSAYGSARALLGRGKPSAVAERLLRKILATRA